MRFQPFIGTFHMTKGSLRCAGKYLRGSGIEDDFLECRILTIVADALTILIMEAFWAEHELNEFQVQH